MTGRGAREDRRSAEGGGGGSRPSGLSCGAQEGGTEWVDELAGAGQLDSNGDLSTYFLSWGRRQMGWRGTDRAVTPIDVGPFTGILEVRDQARAGDGSRG